MAYIILPSPGSEHGPCTESCQHRDCTETRRSAEQVCPVCREPLGYDRKVSGDPLAHYDCLLRQAEAR